jgi:hypothetical protein
MSAPPDRSVTINRAPRDHDKAEDHSRPGRAKSTIRRARADGN